MQYRESFTETVLRLLLYKTLSFKEAKRLIKKKQQFVNVSDSSISNTLYRLRKNGLISKTSTGWSSGRHAEKYLRKRNRFPRKNYEAIKNREKPGLKMVVIYDIPEKMRRERDWLRGELKLLNFKQIQLSAWIGPAPLPRDFTETLQSLKLLKYLHFFKVRKEDVV